MRSLCYFILLLSLSAQAATTKECALAFQKIYGPDEAETKLLKENKNNLFLLRLTKTAEETQKLNEAGLKSLQNEPMLDPAKTKRKLELSEEELHALYRKIMSNPEVQETLTGRYHGSSSRGFCWGRALIADLEADEFAGLHSKSIRKVWAVGDLQADGTSWVFHVTTIVRVKGKGWYAVDPIFGRAMPLEEWVKTMKQTYDAAGTMRILSTPARMYHPEVTEKKKLKQWLQYAEENNFFIDELAEFQRRNRRQRHKLKNAVQDLIELVVKENLFGRPEGYWEKLSPVAKSQKEARAKLRKNIQAALGTFLTAGPISIAAYKYLQPDKKSEQTNALPVDPPVAAEPSKLAEPPTSRPLTQP